MHTKPARAAIAGLASVLTGAAAAHHSPAAFDLGKEIIVEGTLTKFAFANPHTYLTVESAGPDGEVVSQDVEAGPISTIQPRGMTRDSLRVGERVVVRANPSRRGPGHTVLGLDVTRADGRAFPLFVASASVRPASTRLATSLAGVWLPTLTGFSTLNAAVRAHPPNVAPTLQGHSIGYWEGDVLVVDTVAFAPHAEGMGFGMPSSERKHLVERFALSADRRHLDYDVIVDDPLYLTKPARHSAAWEYSPDLRASGV